jgi:hypothetical protein
MSRLHRGGRPPRRKTERLNLLLSETEYENCQRAAEIKGTSMSEILRDGLERVIRHMKNQGQWDTWVDPRQEGEDNAD